MRKNQLTQVAIARHAESLSLDLGRRNLKLVRPFRVGIVHCTDQDRFVADQNGASANDHLTYDGLATVTALIRYSQIGDFSLYIEDRRILFPVDPGMDTRGVSLATK